MSLNSRHFARISWLAGIPIPVPNDSKRSNVTFVFTKLPLRTALMAVIFDSAPVWCVLVAGSTRQAKFDSEEAASVIQAKKEN